MSRGARSSLLDPLRRLKHGSARRLRALADRAVFDLVCARRGRGRVLSGPFAGMKFDAGYPLGTPRAIVLGTYEKELWPFLESIGGLSFDTFVDVGGADGYYAVGGALFWNVGRVVVFEVLEAGRAAIAEHAGRNGVAGRIDLRGLCREEDLLALLDPVRRDLLLMDVEGAEAELLSRRVCDRLRSSVVVVEAHDFVSPGLAEEVAARLAGSHRVQLVPTAPRSVEDWPVRDWAPRRSKLALMDERRPCAMQWVVCFPGSARAD